MILPPPSYPYIFSRPEFFWSTDQKGFSTNFFGKVRQKSFDTKSWHNSLKPKIFRYPKLMTHWWVPIRNFSALSDKKNPTKNRDTPFRPPLIHRLFRYQKFCKAKNGSSTNFFGTVRQKKFDRKSRYSLQPPLFSIYFFETRNFLKHRSEKFLYEIFGTVRQKFFIRK